MHSHHIYASEAGQKRPLAYLQVMPNHHRPRGTYLAAGAVGALAVIGLLMVLGLIAGAMTAGVGA